MTNFEKILTSILGFVICIVVVLAGYNVDLRNADMRYAEINGSNFRYAKTNNTNTENE